MDTNKKQESKAIGLSQDADVIYAAMKRARKKGAKSPTLDALSNEYKISRNAAVNAYTELEAHGLVENIKGRWALRGNTE